MLGALWYSKVLFGSAWINASGVNMSDPDAKKGVGGVMAFTFFLELLTCTGLAILVYRLGLGGFLSGFKLGFLTGICFSSIGIMISYLYQDKSNALKMIDAGYHIAGNSMAAILLCLWQ